MIKILASLLVIVSLLLPTLAQAGDALSTDHCDIVQALDDDSGAPHQDSDDGKPLHHHCCAHSITPAIATADVKAIAVSDAPLVLSDEALSSLASGPPLKPPSHV